MIRKLERDGLLAELTAVEAMLHDIPEEEVANRAGLASRRDEIRAELADVDVKPERGARAALFFGGSPVIGAVGIDAEFASGAIGQYQEIVTRLAAARRRGSLAPTGPIPDRKDSRLHIVGTLHGSFGFELCELEPKPGGDPGSGVTPLAANVERATRILASAGESDEAFGDAIADVDERVVASVREFFGLLRQRRATFRVVAGDLDRSFDAHAVSVAAERTDVKLLGEDDVPVAGEFLGAYPARRGFEMYGEHREVIRGNVSPDLGEQEIIALNRTWSGVPCVAHLRVVRVQRTGAPEQVRYTLLGVEGRGG